mgnify:CR=1 FL=1
MKDSEELPDGLAEPRSGTVAEDVFQNGVREVELSGRARPEDTKGRESRNQYFSRLRTRLARGAHGESLQVIVITSGAPGDGKSMVAFNLALSFAQASGEQPVLLIDADLRRPSISRFLKPRPKQGLLDLLRERASLGEVRVGLTDTRLHVLGAPSTSHTPEDLLAAGALSGIMSECRREYGRVIIDTPPVGVFSDAEIIGSYTDGVLVVARSWHTPKHMYRAALDNIESAPVLGTILNDASGSILDRNSLKGENYYDRYYRGGKRR